MELAHIKGLLERYKKLVFRDEERRREVCAIILSVSGIIITESEMNITKGTLRITGNSVEKNELFLYKERILEELHKKKLTDITDIR